MSETFTHTPGRVYQPEDPRCSDQRRYLGHGKSWHVEASGKYITSFTVVAADVYRDAEYDSARLTIEVTTPAGRCATSANLTPAELRDLAQRLLDAAHDIETNPAALLLAERLDEVAA